MTLKVEQDVEGTTISLGCLFTDNPLPDSLAATEMVFLVRLVRLATREQINPLFVWSSSSWFKRDDYASYFGVKPSREKTHQLKFSARDAQISFLLGFEDPNSFARAFCTWTGETPEKVRAEVRHYQFQLLVRVCLTQKASR